MAFYDSQQGQQHIKMLSKRVLNEGLGIAEFSHLNYLYFARITLGLVLIRVTRGCMPWLLTKRREKGGENFNNCCSCKFFYM